MTHGRFDWDTRKSVANHVKHGVLFEEAQQAFLDPLCLIAEDRGHSADESRLYCIGRIARGILMVRFTIRGNTIRIIGAGFWRKGKRLYEEKNKIHR